MLVYACAVFYAVQVLPANGKLYHAIRQGKVSMLPTYSVTFQNLIKVRQGMGCVQSPHSMCCVQSG
jgi:hypothetical protein